MPTVQERIAEGNEYVRRKIYAFEDALVRELFEAYRIAFHDIEEIIKQMFLAGDFVGIPAREQLMQQIMARMQVLDEQVAQDILEAMLQAHDAELFGQTWALDNGVRGALGEFAVQMPFLPTEAVRAQLLAPYVGRTFVSRFANKRADFEVAVRGALVQSQIQGDGIFQAQRRLAGVLGINISRRTKVDRLAHRADFYRTQMIARTELLRASNLGALSVMEANRDILDGWRWLTAKDDRVCSICAPIDGYVFNFSGKLTEPEGGSVGDAQVPPPAHPQCRCSTTPVLMDRALQERIAGPRETFTEWADKKGINRSRYGQVYGRPGRDAPKVDV